jgi:synaptic vesicle membrane protein VAT-1
MEILLRRHARESARLEGSNQSVGCKASSLSKFCPYSKITRSFNMKQVFIVGYGGAEKLQLRASEDPKPVGDQVRIRVRASGINFADILARQGLYPDAPKAPCVVGYEVSGTVDAVGPGADQSWVGREVLALTRFGGYSDVVAASPKQIFEKPASLSHEQAAAIPVNYLTAWQLLVAMGALKREETVLIHNAGGGVGLAAIDIARHIGATIYGTASSGKHAFLKQRGVHEPIDYRTKDWAAEIDRLTHGKGVQLIIDPLGGKHWKKSYKALRSTGRLGMFGISVVTASKLFGPLRLLPVALGMPFFHPIALMNTNKSVFGVNLGHMWHESGMFAAWMEILMKGVAEGWVRPHVDKSFPLSQAGEAHTYIEGRQNTGKVVLTT